MTIMDRWRSRTSVLTSNARAVNIAMNAVMVTLAVLLEAVGFTAFATDFMDYG